MSCAKEIPSIRIVRHVFIAIHGTDSCVAGTLDGVTCLKPKSDPIHIQKEEELQMSTTTPPVQIVDTRTMAEAAAEASDLLLRWGIAQVRRNNGLTIEVVAERMGMHPEDVVREFESPDSDPHLSSLRRYAHACEALISRRVLDVIPEPITEDA